MERADTRGRIPPSGHASHKGTSDQPNVNLNGAFGVEASDPTTEPEAALLEGAMTNTTRTEEFVNYPPATDTKEQLVLAVI